MPALVGDDAPCDHESDGVGDDDGALGLAAGDAEALPCPSEYVMLRMRLLDVSAMYSTRMAGAATMLLGALKAAAVPMPLAVPATGTRGFTGAGENQWLGLLLLPYPGSALDAPPATVTTLSGWPLTKLAQRMTF